jgi:vancomycin aglycone glucosyltransferase
MWGPAPEGLDNRALWIADAERWNDSAGEALNSQRAAAGLAPVDDVRGHMFTDRPWLAADPTLGPWLRPADLDVMQTGAWITADQRPLPAELLAFLDAGEPPVYFGFGSMHAGQDLGQEMIKAARALGRRAIVARGWADLSPVDDAPDWISIGEINQQALFPRIAAAVHHGGAGTTTAAARAGAPQVIVPQRYDQPYWSRQVDRLGIGTAHSIAEPTADSLATALSHILQPAVVTRAKSIADDVRTDGANIAAQRVIALGARV